MTATLFPLRRRRTSREAITLLDQIRAAGLPDPEPEYCFAKQYGRNWRFDWCWRQVNGRDLKLAIEVQGNLFGRVINVTSGFEYRTIRGQKIHLQIEPGTIFRLGGRHNTVGAGLSAELEKLSWAALLGWSVMPVSTTMIRDDQVIPLLKLAFELRGVKVPAVASPRKELPF